MGTRRPRACVFCGSRDPLEPALTAAAEAMGDALAEAGYDLVYGGTGTGLMGRISTRMLARGAAVIGIMPAAFDALGIAQAGITRLIRVDSMHARKVRMVQESDVFVTLPGGYGTLDELFEVLTLGMLGAHAKPTGILDVAGFFAPLIAWMDRAEAAGFLTPENRRLCFVDPDPRSLVARLGAHRMPEVTPVIRLADG